MRWLSILLVFLSLTAPAQSQFERELAQMYFNQGQYDKALPLYQDFYEKQPTRYHAEHIVQCLVALEKPEDARDFLRKHLKRSNDLPVYAYAELASLDQAMGDEKALKRDLEGIRSVVEQNPALGTTASNMLAERGFYKPALEMLNIMEARLPQVDLSYQKSLLYAELGDLENMFSGLLNWLDRNPGGRPTIQNLFAQWITEDPNNPANQLAKEQLIERTARQDNQVFLELLGDVYKKEGNYRLALRQQVALEKRGINRGLEIMMLGDAARAAGNTDAAIDIYSYLAQNGVDPRFVAKGDVEQQRLKKEMLDDRRADQASYRSWLGDARSTAYARFGNPALPPLLRDMAAVHAYQLKQPDSAFFYLDLADQVHRAGEEDRALNGILRGDIQLFTGDRYESILTFARVEKQFPGSEESDLARYRRGLNAYYTGDFEWARALFKVLKSSTSKRIANDALRYDLLIADHLNLDTTARPLQLYAKADLATYQQRNKAAAAYLDSLESQFPGHSLEEQINWLRLEMKETSGTTEEVRDALEAHATRFPEGMYTDLALLKLGILQQKELNDPATAKKTFERLITTYPASIYAEEARYRNRQINLETPN